MKLPSAASVAVPPLAVATVPGTTLSPEGVSASVSFASTPGAATGMVTLPIASKLSSLPTGGVLGWITTSVAVPCA